jgi:hypothetical protein
LLAMGADLRDSQRPESVSHRPCVVEIRRIALDLARALKLAGVRRDLEVLLQPSSGHRDARVIQGEPTSQQRPEAIGGRAAVGVVAHPPVSVRSCAAGFVAHRVRR